MNMERKISVAKAARIRRHDKICRLFELNKEKYDGRTNLYNEIARKVGVTPQTVIRVLHLRKLIRVEEVEE